MRLKRDPSKFRLAPIVLAAAALTLSAGASAYNLNNTFLFACEVRPLHNPSLYMFVGQNDLVSRYAYAQTYLVTVAPQHYILVDPVIQRCAYATGVNDGNGFRTAGCDPNNIDNKPVFQLQYDRTISGRSVFRFRNLHSNRYLDTWSRNLDYTAIWQHANSSSNNQRFYVDNCIDEFGGRVTPAAS